MRLGWRIGPLFGVRVVVSISWLIIFVLIVLTLETLGVFPSELPPAARWLAALAVGVLFFASVIVHELVHAIVARRQGVVVDEVGLSIIGTQGQLEQPAPTPRADLLVALSAPLVSLLIGGAVLGIGAVVPAAADGTSPLAAARDVVLLIGMANVLLGLVNLVPGVPFDGGRAVRALLWWRIGDFMAAARLASRMGRLLGYAIVAFGVAWTAFGQSLDGIWVAVLGWFLSQAAQMQQRRLEVNHMVEGITVGDVMTQDYSVVGPNLTLDTLLGQHAIDSAANVYPVTDEGRLLGAVEVERVKRHPRQRWSELRVSDVMTRVDRMPRLTVLSSAMDALMLFDRSRATAIPVIDETDRHLVGMLTRDGLIKGLRARRKPLDIARGASGEGTA